MSAAIALRGLTRDFDTGWGRRRVRAVDRVTLEVPSGQVFGLLGPNGSGKSTTLKIILGLLEPTAGECRVFGVPSSSLEARREIGFLPEAPCFYRYLTGRELVRFYATMAGVPRQGREARVADTLDWVGLSHAAERRVGMYSKGMLQRIGLAQAIVHDPKLVILDEPTAGVDPVGTREIAEWVRRLRSEGKTVLITSHNLTRIEEMCDRVAILDRGRLVVEGDVPGLTGCRDRQALVVTHMPPDELAELRHWLAHRGRVLEAVETPARGGLEALFQAIIESRGSLGDFGARGDSRLRGDEKCQRAR